MKRNLSVVLIMLTALGLAQGQSAPSKPKAPAATAPHREALAADAAVITIPGSCPAQEKPAGNCQTVVTRAEFERLMTVLSRLRSDESQKSIPAEAKRQLAMQYSRMLLFSDLAEKQGLQNTPEGAELIRFARMQALTEELARSLREKATPTPAEIRQYYDANADKFAELNLQRLIVPLGKPAGQDVRKTAEAFYRRAKNGESFAVLQKEAFSQAAVPGAPEVNLTLPADAALPAAHASVLHLKPGEFSVLIEDNAGFFIYKLDSIHRIPMEQKRAEIQEAVVAQKADFALRKIGESAAFTLNPLYFDSTPTPVSDQAAARPKPADRAVRVEAR